MTHHQNEPASGPRGGLSRRSLLTMLAAAPVIAAGAPAVVAATRGPAAGAADIVVDPSATRQTVQGFGGMNHTGWIDDLTAAQRRIAFGNEAGELGFSILRIPVHEDRANWANEVATAQAAVERGAKVFASPWNPPSDMVETSGESQRLRDDRYGAYAQHLNDFHEFMRGEGVDLYAISVQNEPDYAHDWTTWTSAEIIRFLKENAPSIGTRIIAPESFQYVKSLSDPILNDAEALANMDILGAHLYGTPFDDFAYPLFEQVGAGKELWMTEVYHPNSSDDADAWPQALDVAEHVHRAMVDANFQTYVWWYIRRSYGPMAEDGHITKRGAGIAHFSKFVRPGAVRVEVTPAVQQDLYVSAYAGGSGETTVVAVNKGTSPVDQRFALSGTSATTAGVWLTDSGRTVEPQADLPVQDGAVAATLPAQSVTTLVVG